MTQRVRRRSEGRGGVLSTPAGGPARAVAIALCAALLAACSEDSPTEVVLEVIEDVTFDASLGIDLAQMTELPSGVYVEDKVVGSGAVIASGDIASVEHSGWLRDGTLFSGGPFEFNYLVDDLIVGFEQGVEGMAVGGTRLIIIPPELAYGRQGSRGGVVPPGAIVVFEVELISLS